MTLIRRRLHRRLFLLLLCFISTLEFVKPFLVVKTAADIDGRSPSKACASLSSSSSSSENENENEASTSSPPKTTRFQRQLQIREKSRNRRPRNYWLDLTNVAMELYELWDSVNVTTTSTNSITSTIDQPPPIPNEALLNYWKRHDLRAAIVTHGGREYLSESLGGAFIIPGRWSLAVQTKQVQELLEHDPNLSSELPPLSPQQLKGGVVVRNSTATAAVTEANGSKIIKVRRKPSWYNQHQGAACKKEKGYWSSDQIVIQELFEYLEHRRHTQHLPPVWMPRLSELTGAGREDLQRAIRRFGGSKVICRKAGLVPFREWNYIEGMYDLFLELKSYLDEYHDGDYQFFPVVYLMKERGYERLHSLIQYYGGRKFLACRLDMEHTRTKIKRKKQDMEAADMNWGLFDLDFGIDLLEVVRNENLNRRAPLWSPVIVMPSQLKLLSMGQKGIRLDEKIQEYGGYENVARRLGLAYFVR